MKILNLYAGIGGNRKLWGDEHEVTAVENNPEILSIYESFFPEDKTILGDAHQYLLNHFQEFDFIWSSPPCPTHSRVRKQLAFRRNKDGEKYLQNKPVFPDMRLYQEIIFLQGYFKGFWIVENVISYYEPLIKPQKIARHFFWSNFKIKPIEIKGATHQATIKEMQNHKGFDISQFKLKHRKDTILRNCVDSNLALHILNCALNKSEEQKTF